LPSIRSHTFVEACHEPGCPVCRLEQRGVERYLDNQFYENVNSPAWRDHLRASHAFCHEHAWLAVNKRLGDALGFSIIYHDIVNNILRQWQEDGNPGRGPRRGSLREKVLAALGLRQRCPVCEHREEITRNILSALLYDLPGVEVMDALRLSEGLCLPHLKLSLDQIQDGSVYESIVAVHREKLETLKVELAEFIRKNDYQAIKEGFGSEGDAWLRAIGMIVGSRKDR